MWLLLVLFQNGGWWRRYGILKNVTKKKLAHSNCTFLSSGFSSSLYYSKFQSHPPFWKIINNLPNNNFKKCRKTRSSNCILNPLLNGTLSKTEKKIWLFGWLTPSLMVPRPDNNATEDDDDILLHTGGCVLAVVLPGGYER